MKTPEQWANIIYGGIESWRKHNLTQNGSLDAMVEAFRRAQAEALEAQHRKTWAEAMELGEGELINQHASAEIDGYQAAATLRALPCPPLTNESKK
jgi:hypothetical protein